MARLIPARIVLIEWLSDHPAELMHRAWNLTEAQRRRIASILEEELGEPPAEYLVPAEAIAAMGQAGEEHGLVVWGASEGAK